MKHSTIRVGVIGVGRGHSVYEGRRRSCGHEGGRFVRHLGGPTPTSLRRIRRCDLHRILGRSEPSSRGIALVQTVWDEMGYYEV